MGSINYFRPLHKSLTVAESKIHGLGIIAKEDIDAEADLGLSHIRNKNYKDSLIRTPLSGFLNHSTSPNAYYKISANDLRVTTKRPIKKGEEITVSYREFYSEDAIDRFN